MPSPWGRGLRNTLYVLTTDATGRPRGRGCFFAPRPLPLDTELRKG